MLIINYVILKLFINFLENSLITLIAKTPINTQVDIYNEDVLFDIYIIVEHIGEPVEIMLVKIL